ncbi:FeoA family protein [Arcanobacterium phocae]|uniref:FeoA family protein n=1 Tax=Arcanobacterium phocae TaxID=131112 RepID=UPI001C0EDDFB|nr:FeoA family protein [Arcanobacterium phocae]
MLFRSKRAQPTVEHWPDSEAASGQCGHTLLEAEVGRTYTVQELHTGDSEMDSFLLRLGCYVGESITVLSKKKNSCIVVIKDGRYAIDNVLAGAIVVSCEVF